VEQEEPALYLVGQVLTVLTVLLLLAVLEELAVLVIMDMVLEAQAVLVETMV
jgi:hypothetical protein